MKKIQIFKLLNIVIKMLVNVFFKFCSYLQKLYFVKHHSDNFVFVIMQSHI